MTTPSSPDDINGVPDIHRPEKVYPDESLHAPLREELSKLTDDSGAALHPDEIEAFFQPEALNRVLIARGNNLIKATALAKQALLFRSKYRPSTLTVADFETANQQGVWRSMGLAKNGWPMLLVKAGLWEPSKYDVHEYVRMVSFHIEGCIKMAKNPLEDHGFVIIDMKGMSYFKGDMTKLRQLAKLASEFYPECLGIFVVVNADLLTMTIWNVLKLLVDKRTLARAVFFRGGYEAFLAKHVGRENLTTDLGGTREEEWPMTVDGTFMTT